MNLNKIWRTLFKQSIVVFLFVLTLVVSFAPDVSLKTCLNIVAFELLTLWLVYLVLYIFSPINFILKLHEGMNDEIQSHKTIIAASIIAAVFISVHLLSGLAIWGIYFTNYRPVP